MAGASESRRRMMVVAHHHKALDDSFLAPALMSLGSSRWTKEYALNALQKARQLPGGLRGGIPLIHPHPAPRFAGHDATLSVVCQQSESFGMSNGRMATAPALSREPENWLWVGSGSKTLDHTAQLDADWFIEKVQRFLPAFEPDFACGDTDVLLGNRFGDDPVHVAWPLVYYGPALAKEFGREKLLKSPVWEAKEDGRGGIWLQVAENPFVATKEQINALASHLGLPKRK